MPSLFLGLLEDSATRPVLQALLQGRVFESRDADALSELQAHALALERGAVR